MVVRWRHLKPPGTLVLPARFARPLAVLTLAAALGACASPSPEGGTPASASPAAASMTADPVGSTTPDSAGWRPLLGATTAAWRGFKRDRLPDGWTVADGVLAKQKPVEDIVSIDQFGDFELELDWKISSGGNSGIFFRGAEDEEKIYWTAPEYQLLDDIQAADNKTRLTCAGAAYGLYPSPTGHLKPVGEWNRTRLVARGAHVEHWLNGTKLLEYELWSPDWEAKVKASKFVAWPRYGRLKSGHLSLQGDHEGALAFRNIRIRDLK